MCDSRSNRPGRGPRLPGSRQADIPAGGREPAAGSVMPCVDCRVACPRGLRRPVRMMSMLNSKIQAANSSSTQGVRPTLTSKTTPTAKPGEVCVSHAPAVTVSDGAKRRRRTRARLNSSENTMPCGCGCGRTRGAQAGACYGFLVSHNECASSGGTSAGRSGLVLPIFSGADFPQPRELTTRQPRASYPASAPDRKCPQFEEIAASPARCPAALPCRGHRRTSGRPRVSWWPGRPG